MKHLKTDRPVTVEIVRKVRRNCLGKFESELRKLIRFASTAPGHRGATVIKPPPGSTEYHVLIRFDCEGRFQAFQDSKGLKEWYQRIRPLLLEDPTIRITHGLEAWFTLAEHPRHQTPVKWKMALVTWAAVYVCVILFSFMVKITRQDFHPLIQTLIVSFLVTIALTWVLLPWLTRRLKRWLFHSRSISLPAAYNQSDVALDDTERGNKEFADEQ